MYVSETPWCDDDVILVHDGPSAGSPSFGRFCQQGSNVSITSTGNQMFVMFRSTTGTRQSQNIKGFKATFTEGKYHPK